MRNAVFEGLADAARSGESVALGLITGVRGSSPQKAGAKALFYADGRVLGTLGGGCLEAEIQRRALRSLEHGRPETFEFVLDQDFGWDDSLLCGGTVRGLILPRAQLGAERFWKNLATTSETRIWGVRADYSLAEVECGPDPIAAGTSPSGLGGDWLYREQVAPLSALWIAGAGHIAQAVAPLALALDFSVAVFDDRAALANPRNFPSGTVLHAGVWEELLALPLPTGPAFGLIVTRGFRHDVQVLEHWIHQPFGFLAMIGSERKALMIFDRFAREGLATAAELQRLACPAGIKIRCQTVTEIAVSIMAQFIDKRAELA